MIQSRSCAFGWAAEILRVSEGLHHARATEKSLRHKCRIRMAFSAILLTDKAVRHSLPQVLVHFQMHHVHTSYSSMQQKVLH